MSKRAPHGAGIVYGTMIGSAMWIVIILVVSAIRSDAHEWYDPECCSGQDCAPVAREHVVATPDGWQVRLKPGEHPNTRFPVDRTLPYTSPQVRHSQDSDFHACVLGGTLLCLYVPDMGS